MTPRARARACIHADREVEGTDRPFLDEPTERRKRLAELKFRVGLSVIAFLRGAEGPLYVGIVIEERKEYGDAFDDGSSQFWLDASPVVIEPTLDCPELFNFPNFLRSLINVRARNDFDAEFCQSVSNLVGFFNLI